MSISSSRWKTIAIGNRCRLKGSKHQATSKRGTALIIGIGIALLSLLLSWSDLLELYELKALDQRFRSFADPSKANRDLVLLAIDEPSLEAFGQWPWPRDRHGYVVDYLKRAGAKAVVFDVMFFESDSEAEEFDATFAQAITAAGNVFLPLLFLEHDPTQATHTATPDMVDQAAASVQVTSSLTNASGIQTFPGLKLPLSHLRSGVKGMGFINVFPDPDGTIRRLPLIGQAGLDTYLQLAATVVQHVYDIEAVTLTHGQLSFGPWQIPLTDKHELLIIWHGGDVNSTYPAYSMGAVLQSVVDLHEGRQPLLDETVFRDKIVFIAATAAGLHDLRVTPLSSATPGVLTHMTIADNLLQGDFLRQASPRVTLLLVLIMGMMVSHAYLLPDKQLTKLMLSIAPLVVYMGIALYGFAHFRLWLPLILPLLTWALAFAVSLIIALLTEGRQRRYLRAVFDKYMAAAVVDELLSQPGNIQLGGKKEEITLFFSDVAGFTSIAETLDPEDLVALLNEYLTMMTDIIMKYRGNVNKYMGDGIMAFFGAPKGDAQHATQACLAALECQQTLTRLQAQWTSRGFPPLITRIGLNSGEVVVGNMGSHMRMEYTAMGDNVNLAARLEGANKYYGTTILLGPRTYDLARSDIEAREIDALRVKGKSEPVIVYELLGERAGLSVAKRQCVRAFLQGLRHYKERTFDLAKVQFEKALAIEAHDGPSRIYLSRVQDYLITPPPSDWDGVYQLRSK